MSSQDATHRRTHNLLLISKLLTLRDNVSPFTLVIDSLEQSSAQLFKEYIRRAKGARTHVIYISFERLDPPEGVETFLYAREKRAIEISRLVSTTISNSSTSSKRYLILLDCIHPLLSGVSTTADIPSFFSSLLLPPKGISQAHISLVAAYHSDVATPHSKASYSPSPLTLLNFLATTILTLHSFSQLLEEKAARDRSIAAPIVGLASETDGVLIGLPHHSSRGHSLRTIAPGFVIEMEHRRKSGRGIVEWYFLPSSSQPWTPQSKESAWLLQDHPAYNPAKDGPHEVVGTDADGMESTFDLGLTERQRRDREGVVLPYFDAQKGGDGPGEGGRILYDMGEEDDFDEEEDEI